VSFSFKAVALSGLIFSSTFANSADLALPDLGNVGADIISASQEYELGQRWQRMFRAQVPTSQDPFLQIYVENLLGQLARHSDLEDKRLDVLIVENPSLNAFAVPGGVVGVNTGLFNFAQNEQQFASVMAHELAHLSQRHFARQLDEQRNNSVPNVAALLASILVLASAGGEAGVAAISASQAAMIDSRLRFSRQMEQEADRIGMETMVRAQMDPYAMPDMFEQMLYASRFSARPPEFLITHPLPESRVSDSKLRAQQYGRKAPLAPDDMYQLMRVRAQAAHAKDTNYLIRSFEGILASNKGNALAARYGLAVAYQKSGNLEAANLQLDELLRLQPQNLVFITTKAQVEAQAGNVDQALERLAKQRALYPTYHPLVIVMAEILMKSAHYKECEALLLEHSERRPKDEYVWYLLAEAHGLAGNILEVHTARMEYFLLNGLYDKAANHIRHALKLTQDKHTRAKLEIRLKEVQRLKREEGRS
jgi:predicted Zn-dependent protease